MRAAVDLLEQAEYMLAGDSSHGNRIACWIARVALEGAIDELLAQANRPAPHATTRSKLTVLEIAYLSEPAIPQGAEYAWGGLSQLCHQHAFELTPSAAEVRHLLDLVRGTCSLVLSRETAAEP